MCQCQNYTRHIVHGTRGPEKLSHTTYFPSLYIIDQQSSSAPQSITASRAPFSTSLARTASCSSAVAQGSARTCACPKPTPRREEGLKGENETGLRDPAEERKNAEV